MENVSIEVTRDDILVLRIDLKESGGFTRGGRSIRIGSSEGNLTLWKDGSPDSRNIKINCNVFRSLTPEEKKEAQKRFRWP